MSIATPTTQRTAFRVGSSLVEMTVVIVVIGILTAMAAPSFQRATEQARADFAVANLRAVWSAQRFYWLEHHAYATDLATLQGLRLLDPTILLTTGDYTYAITSADANVFEAVAIRAGGTAWAGQFSIDETGQVTGALHGSGMPDMVPGFQ